MRYSTLPMGSLLGLIIKGTDEVLVPIAEFVGLETNSYHHCFTSDRSDDNLAYRCKRLDAY